MPLPGMKVVPLLYEELHRIAITHCSRALSTVPVMQGLAKRRQRGICHV